jgi:membrane-bound lytic murein transglycosylase B
MCAKDHSSKYAILVSALLAILLTVLSAHAETDTQDRFEAWLDQLKKDALEQGISRETLEAALTGLEPIPRIITLDRNQPEFKLTLKEYLPMIVSEDRIATGRQKLEEHRSLLTEISTAYGIHPRFLVALWGIETSYGRLSGNYSVISATATLAFEGRRGSFFRKELLTALRILDKKHIPLDQMLGSWAGAMGQFQFMPSTFGQFGVDYDNDGRIDIWNNLPDAFASAANYLARGGWETKQTWGRPVQSPERLHRSLIGFKAQRPLSAWQALGIRRADGGPLPVKPNLTASLIQPDGPGEMAFLVYQNYRVLLKWNASHLFGLTVGTLADRIAGR